MIEAFAHLAAWLHAAGIDPAKVRVVLEFDERTDAYRADDNLRQNTTLQLVYDPAYRGRPPTINGIRYDFRFGPARNAALDHLRAAMRELER